MRIILCHDIVTGSGVLQLGATGGGVLAGGPLRRTGAGFCQVVLLGELQAAEPCKLGGGHLQLRSWSGLGCII